MSAWKTVACRLEESCLGIFDCPHTTAPDEGVGYPLIRTPNVGRGRLKLEGVHRVSESVYEQRNFRAKPEPGDLIFAREAPAGNVACIQEGEWVCLGQRTVLIRPDRKKLDSNFLAYYLLTEEKQQEFGVLANGATVAHVNMPDIRNLPISVPPLPAQRRIAAVLSSLDDKIENNHKMCKNLEEQAQAIFKSWFVDFEPFGGEMPKEWQMGKLSDIAQYDNRRISVSELSAESYYSTENMLTDRGGVVAASSLPENGEVPRCDEGAVLVSNIRPYFKKICRVSETGGHSADVLCFVAREPAMKWYLYRLLWDDAFFAYVMSGVKGCKMPRGDKEQIMEYGCVRPDGKTLSEFNAALEPICRKVALCCNESRALAELRDALLPKLMAGEIDVGGVAV